MWSESETGGRVTAGTFQPSSIGPTKLAITSPLGLAHTKLFGVALLGLPGEVGSTDVLAARVIRSRAGRRGDSCCGARFAERSEANKKTRGRDVFTCASIS